MHLIRPYERWLQYYDPAYDDLSPFAGKSYDYDRYSDTIYGYFIDPAWDFMGSETLYIKILYANYEEGYCVLEFIGEWNDAINNDIMHLKRNVVDLLLDSGIDKFLLIGESVFNFHGSDDCYYEEWFEEVEDGWIAMMGFQEHTRSEMKKYNIDSYINMEGPIDIIGWRTMYPLILCKNLHQVICKRIGLS